MQTELPEGYELRLSVDKRLLSVFHDGKLLRRAARDGQKLGTPVLFSAKDRARTVQYAVEHARTVSK